MGQHTPNAADQKIIRAGSHTWREAAVIGLKSKAKQQTAEFLQGYLTCDTTQLDKARAQPMALCNVKGRVVANGWLIDPSAASTPTAVEADLCLVVHASLGESTVEFLTPYARFSRCSVTLETAARLRICAPSAGIRLADTVSLDLGTPHTTADMRDASPLMRRLLVAQEWVWIEQATHAQYLPHNIGLVAAGAVDFDKGCYLGQEIVARVEFRGKVKREIGEFSWQTAPPAVGEQLKTGATVVMVAHDADAKSTQVPSGSGLAVN